MSEPDLKTCLHCGRVSDRNKWNVLVATNDKLACPRCGLLYQLDSDPSWHYRQEGKAETAEEAIKRCNDAIKEEGRGFVPAEVSWSPWYEESNRKHQADVELEDRIHNTAMRILEWKIGDSEVSREALDAAIDRTAIILWSAGLGLRENIRSRLLKRYEWFTPGPGWRD